MPANWRVHLVSRKTALALATGLIAGIWSWTVLGPKSKAQEPYREFVERHGLQTNVTSSFCHIENNRRRAHGPILSALFRWLPPLGARGVRVIQTDVGTSDGKELAFFPGGTGLFFVDDHTLAVSYGDDYEDSVYFYELPPRLPAARIVSYGVSAAIAVFLMSSLLAWSRKRGFDADGRQMERNNNDEPISATSSGPPCR